MTTKECFEDRAAIMAALHAWFDSQGIGHERCALMANAIGIMLHEHNRDNMSMAAKGLEIVIDLLAVATVKGE